MTNKSATRKAAAKKPATRKAETKKRISTSTAEVARANSERSAKKRTELLLAKLSRAKAEIERRIDSNGGVYPFNKGRVTVAEVCRVAGVRKSVLQGPKHKKTTNVELLAWIEELKKKMTVGSDSVRRAVTQRADDWKQKYLDAAHHSNLYHLQMVSLSSKLAASEKKVKELEAEVVRLQVAVSGGRVSKLPENKR